MKETVKTKRKKLMYLVFSVQNLNTRKQHENKVSFLQLILKVKNENRKCLLKSNKVLSFQCQIPLLIDDSDELTSGAGIYCLLFNCKSD